MPLPSVAVNPITLATSVLNVKYSLSATPRRIVFISGMPEPILCGATKCTKPAENRINDTGNETHAKYCIYGCDVRSLYNQIRAEFREKSINYYPIQFCTYSLSLTIGAHSDPSVHDE